MLSLTTVVLVRVRTRSSRIGTFGTNEPRRAVHATQVKPTRLYLNHPSCAPGGSLRAGDYRASRRMDHPPINFQLSISHWWPPLPPVSLVQISDGHEVPKPGW